MSGKVLVGVLIILSLLLSSCYPELSVQQYDKLKADIAALDTERQQLQERLEALEAQAEAQLTEIVERNTETRAYVEFLGKLLAIQGSDLILSGEFNFDNLVASSEELRNAAKELGDSDIDYYLSLIDPENESQSVGAYYKAIEYCIKKLKQNLP